MVEILEVYSTGKRKAAINDCCDPMRLAINPIFFPGVCFLCFNPHGHVPTQYPHGNVQSLLPTLFASSLLLALLLYTRYLRIPLYPSPSILVVAKAERSETAPIGLAQLMVYIAAIHESRLGKENNRVFGMFADSAEFKFCYLDCDCKLLVSNTLHWATQRSRILTYLDTVLLDAFETIAECQAC